MAGQYNNMIKELIIQTRLNSQLINDVNNRLEGYNELSFEELKEIHQNRIINEYNNANLNNLPIYDYFDGTQLINSLFSTIVVPIEFLKGRFNGKRTENVLKDTNHLLYNECLGLINAIPNMIDTYRRNNDYISVYQFFTHLRNALCHSGNGNIHFFPNGGRDITTIFFYDEDRYNETKVFRVELNIFNELIPLVEVFDKLIIDVATNDNRQLDMEQIEARIHRVLNHNRG